MFNKVIKYHVASANNENGKFCHVILTEPDNQLKKGLLPYSTN